jgi:hypothetical protein
MSISKKAVVILTRGYNRLEQYNSLIQRNNSITFQDKSTDFLIFHEGNILETHKRYISQNSPHLRIRFIDISEKAFKEDKKEIPVYSPTQRFSLNYRHMCHFWFVDFWHFVKEYDCILRIDEDCIIDFSVDHVFSLLKNDKLVCLYGQWEPDHEFVTHGMNQFTREFISRKTGVSMEKISMVEPSGPYTNVIGLNLKKLRENRILQEYIDIVDKSNVIYQYRWGDLPLWGQALTYFCQRDTYSRWNKIKYYHGSHMAYVGGIKPLKRMTLS